MKDHLGQDEYQYKGIDGAFNIFYPREQLEAIKFSNDNNENFDEEKSYCNDGMF